MAEQFHTDVLVVGGGPAGLSAALLLARARRRVIVIDDGRPRNAAARAVHGFLTRDGIAPAELRETARREVSSYGVRLLPDRVVRAYRHGAGFAVATETDERFSARKLVVATGLTDELPAIEGLAPLYGRRVFHCPYCDGWEVRDRALVAIAESSDAVELAIEVRQWSTNLVLCTNGSTALTLDARARLSRAGIRVLEQRVERLVESTDGGELEIQLRDASTLRAEAVFVETRKRQSSDLARQLGCDAYDPAGCAIEKRGHTNVPGLYVIGDASRDVLQVVVAAAEGAEVAIAINTELTREDLGET